MTTPNLAILKALQTQANTSTSDIEALETQADASTAAGLFVRTLTVVPDDIDVAATSADLALGAALPAGACIMGVDLTVATGFAGLTTPTIVVDDGDSTEYLGSTGIGSTTRVTVSVDAAESDGNGVTGSVTIAAVNNLENASAGELTVTLVYAIFADAQTPS